MISDFGQQKQKQAVLPAEKGRVEPENRRKTKVGQAVEKAAEVFARRPLPVGCELDDTEFIELPGRNCCERRASWLAVYREREEKPWHTAFLCTGCKRAVQRALGGNLSKGESLVLVKDWRV
jgi:hypothetical protein